MIIHMFQLNLLIIQDIISDIKIQDVSYQDFKILIYSNKMQVGN